MAHVTTAHPAVLAKKKRAPLPRSLQRFFLEKKLTRPPPNQWLQHEPNGWKVRTKREMATYIFSCAFCLHDKGPQT